jgi:hypothetical protein
MSGTYALFIYNPMMNSTTFATTHDSKEALIVWAHEKFHDNLMFSIYKLRDHCRLFEQKVPATRWDLDTKFDGKKIANCHKRFNQPMETAYHFQDGFTLVDEGTWFFKTI